MTGKRAAAFLLLAVAIAALSIRAYQKLNIPGAPDGEHWVLQDFRDIVYYPVVALRGGVNPYDTKTYPHAYPIGSPGLPVYSPFTLLVHFPFGCMPYVAAELAYFSCTIALTILLGWLALRFADARRDATAVAFVGALILLSRPGYMNLLDGQYAVSMSLGTVLALHYGATRPWLGGLGLALATVKPTFGVPLMILMAFRRHYRALLIGVLIGGLGALTGAGLIMRASGIGPMDFLRTVLENPSAFAANPNSSSVLSWIRIDALSIVGRLSGESPFLLIDGLVFVAVLGTAGLSLRSLSRRSEENGMAGIAGAIASLAILICMYHQAYDALLLTVPAVCALRMASLDWRVLPRGLRATVVVTMLVPAVNYAATGVGLRLLAPLGNVGWLIATSTNALALLLAYLLLLYSASLVEHRTIPAQGSI